MDTFAQSVQYSARVAVYAAQVGLQNWECCLGVTQRIVENTSWYDTTASHIMVK